MQEPEIKLSPKHYFRKGYIVRDQVEITNLPSFVEIEGQKLIKKSAFHISLVCAKRLIPIVRRSGGRATEKDFIHEFQGFITQHSLEKYTILNEFRLVQSEIKQTLIVMCDVPGVNDLFKHLSERFEVDLPLQPLHITLYTRQPESGIGILSYEELERISKVIDPPVVINKYE